MSIVDTILKCYAETKSIKGTAKMTDCSWNRVVKILASNNIVVNQTHTKILDLYKQGKAKQEIARTLHLSEKTVQSYLPATRPFYGVNLSENAKRIQKCRRNKKKRGGNNYEK